MIAPTFNQTITVYNKHVDRSMEKTVTTWNRTVLSACYFGKVKAGNVQGNTQNSTSTFVCRIPQNPAYAKHYEGKVGTFTLAPGDIIVEGEVTDEIADKQGQRAADLLQKYHDSCFEIKAVSENTVLAYAPHYRATGG